MSAKLPAPPGVGGRDNVRARVRGARRFHPAGSRPPEPPEGDGGVWPRPGVPSGSERRLEWPFWVLLLLPWLMWVASLVLEHMNVCLICIPANVTIPGL